MATLPLLLFRLSSADKNTRFGGDCTGAGPPPSRSSRNDAAGSGELPPRMYYLVMGNALAILVLIAGLSTAGPVAAADTFAAAIPPGEAAAKAALETSPRHHEWVMLPPAGDAGALSLFVAYPERRDKAPVVLVIHEVYGLTDWIRAVADRLAADGFIAIAPDMLTGRGPGGGGTDKFPSRDDAVKAVRELAPGQVTAALDAAARYGRSLPAAADKLGTVGFCWGGAQSFSYAAARPDLGAAVVYYGTSPADTALAGLRAPVLGLYGEDDARVNATVAPAEARLKELGRTFVTATYPGAGHGFLRALDDREGANLAAALQPWPATVAFLRKHLE